MDSESMISRLLAAQAAAGPPKLGGLGPPITVAEGCLLGVYHAVLANDRGWGGSDKDVERSVRLARKAKLPEGEIEAAIAAGRATEGEQ